MDDQARGILVMLDGSETAERALDLAIARAAERHEPVTCIAIVPPRLWRAKQGQFQMAPEKHDESFAQGLVVEAQARCHRGGVDARSVVRSGPPATVLVEEAGRGYGLLVLGERRLPTGAPTLGSIVAGRVPIPVEIVREP